MLVFLRCRFPKPEASERTGWEYIKVDRRGFGEYFISGFYVERDSMVRANKRVRPLGIALAVLMLPLFMGIVCPCVNAAVDEMVIQTQPCHGCCPEMLASHGDCDAKLEARDAVKTPEVNPLIFSFETILGPDSVSGKIHVPSAGPPVDRPITRHEPTFVLNQVFRL